MEMIKRFLWEEEALTVVEYGIMLAVLALVVIGAMVALFTNIGVVFSNWSTWFASAPAPASI